MKRSQLKRGTGLDRRSPLAVDPGKVREWLRRSQDRARKAPPAAPAAREERTMAWALRAPFRPRTPARKARCYACGARAEHWHHWLAQQQLKTYVRWLAQQQRMAPSEVRRLLGDLLADERNLLALCDRCHMQHEHSGRPGGGVLSADDVPAEAVLFAATLGAEWVERLRRAYL